MKQTQDEKMLSNILKVNMTLKILEYAVFSKQIKDERRTTSRQEDKH